MKLNNLKVAAVQCDIAWEDSQSNIEQCIEFIKNSDAELIVLPEMVATGFSMNPTKIAQSPEGEIVTKFQNAAKENQKAIIFSAAIKESDSYFNRLFFISDKGEITTYNKVHLFRMAGEHNNYSAGEGRVIIEYKGFRICPMVCYDLRFPVFSRNKNDYDLAIYIASWPEPRSYAWSTLLRARAIENQCFCIGVNRVGDDPKNSYSGDSVVLNFLGQPIATATPKSVEVIEATLELEELRAFRESFPAHLDADNFEIL